MSRARARHRRYSQRYKSAHTRPGHRLTPLRADEPRSHTWPIPVASAKQGSAPWTTAASHLADSGALVAAESADGEEPAPAGSIGQCGVQSGIAPLSR
jgi:hypothetical protein